MNKGSSRSSHKDKWLQLELQACFAKLVRSGYIVQPVYRRVVLTELIMSSHDAFIAHDFEPVALSSTAAELPG